ncbi:MAG: hypothetical protein OEV00_06425, partial [Acidobacteriota bacterium]|nr:hypothetical protein [Acidobacteriota bacterium]
RIGLWVASLLVSIVSASAEESQFRMENDPDCSGAGIRGQIDGQLQFTACDDGRILVAALYDGSSLPITELRYDRVTQRGTFRLAGLDPDQGRSPQSEKTFRDLMTGPVPGHVEQLTRRIRQEADRYDQVLVQAIVVQGQAFETATRPIRPRVDCQTCRDPSSGCGGCCGLGCPGCTVCSDACLQHDECVREQGHLPCVHLLAPAVISALRCIVTSGAGVGCCPVSVW